MVEDDKMIRRADVCEILGVTPRQVQLWREAGSLWTWRRKEGDSFYYSLKEIMKIKESMKNE